MAETKSTEALYKDHKTSIIISANMGLIAFAASTAFIDNWGFYFYEQMTSAGTKWITIGYLIYGLWDAFNDPMFGFLSDKTYRFTKRWGRRFPWIVFGTIPFCISMWLIFAVPDVTDQVITVIWMIASLITYETLYTMIQTSTGALYPDKFRSKRDRERLVVINQVLWFVGFLMGIFLPGVFFFGNSASQDILSKVAIYLAIVSLIGMLVMIPGVRESPELIERTLRVDKEKKQKYNFFKTFGHLLTNRNFLGYFFATLGMMILQSMTIVSVPYIVQYLAGYENIFLGSMFIQFGYAGFAVLSVPLWLALMKKYNYQKLYTYAFLIVPVALMLFFFFSNIWIFTALSCIVGIGIGGMSMLGSRMYWSVVDEACVEIGERKEGAYSGIFTFMQRIGPIIATSLIGLIHLLTGFLEPTEVDGQLEPSPFQPDSALLGIRLGVSFIPVAIALIGFLLFRLLFRLTSEQAEENLEKMKEMGI